LEVTQFKSTDTQNRGFSIEQDEGLYDGKRRMGEIRVIGKVAKIFIGNLFNCLTKGYYERGWY